MSLLIISQTLPFTGKHSEFGYNYKFLFSLFKLSFYKKVCAFFCYFSCASKKSKEYKQKEKYKFMIEKNLNFLL